MAHFSFAMCERSNSSYVIVPDDYPTIQLAINNVANGGTIFVRIGLYAENIVVSKSVSLIGEDKQETIIGGVGLGTTIQIEASNTSVIFFGRTSKIPAIVALFKHNQIL